MFGFLTSLILEVSFSMFYVTRLHSIVHNVSLLSLTTVLVFRYHLPTDTEKLPRVRQSIESKAAGIKQ